MKKLFLLLIATINMAVCSSQENSKSTFKYVSTIDSLSDELLKDSLINSLSVGVYYKGDKFSNHYGEIDKGKGNRPTDKTIYEIASVSKTFVGILLAQAESEGKLSLEDDIRKYIGEAYSNFEYKGNPIKIKHLLTHTSLLPRSLPAAYDDVYKKIDPYNFDVNLLFQLAEIERNYTKTEFLTDLKTVTIDTLPGTRMDYSNADTELACYILEKVYNKSFEAILVEELCAKLNMLSTKIDLDETEQQLLATGYFDKNRKMPFIEEQLWGGAGSIKSTTHDLLNYIEFQLDKENKVVQKTHEVLYDKGPVEGSNDKQLGYFWVLSNDNKLGKCIEHHGGAYGTNSFVFLYPDADLGITIITNQGHFATGGKLYEFVNNLISKIDKN